MLDDWRYVGTAQDEHEIPEVMQTRPRCFDQNTYAFLAKTLHRLPPKRILRLPPRA